MLEFFRFILVILSLCVLGIFAGVTYIMSKQENKKGIGLAIFIVVSQVIQIIYLLL